MHIAYRGGIARQKTGQVLHCVERLRLIDLLQLVDELPGAFWHRYHLLKKCAGLSRLS
jgi:hypothetical protein